MDPTGEAERRLELAEAQRAEAYTLVQRALAVAEELDCIDEHGPDPKDVAKLLRELAEALEDQWLP